MNKNVIVLMLDTLSFMYMGCYGNKWIETPNMDRLAREGILFENNYIDNLPTIPCRRSMLTGRYSIHYRGWSPLEFEETTIADLCWGRPVDTALIYDCPMYRLPKFGYTRGFDKVWYHHGHELGHDFYAGDPLLHLDPRDYMSDRLLENADKVLGYPVIESHMAEVADHLKIRQYWKSEEDQFIARVIKRSVEYLEQVDRNKQFFLWIDSFDPHEPWTPPSVLDPHLKCPYDPDYKGKDIILPVSGPTEGMYSEEELHHIRMIYAETVTMCDRWVGYLLDKVRDLGLEENTLFLLVSDHGHPMGEGEHGHGLMRKGRPWPYEELAHAPMIMRAPGLPAGKRIPSFTQSCDVAPTVLDWLGLPEHEEHTGKSLLPLATGETDKLRDIAVAGYYEHAWALHTEDYSFIHWAKPDEKTEGDKLELIAAKQMAPTSKMIAKAGAGKIGGLKKKGASKKKDPQAKMLKQASLDEADMWTCVPGSTVEVPESDELYDRKADPFQLNDIAKKDPQKTEEMYGILREFMAELMTT